MNESYIEEQLTRISDSPLVKDNTLLCPRCETAYPAKTFVILGLSPRYAEHLNRIFRCPECSHLFSPRSNDTAPRQ